MTKSRLLGFNVYQETRASFFELFDRTGDDNRVLASWLHGVIGVPTWTELAVSAALLALATVAALPLMRTLNTLVLGDEYAQQLGVRVETARVSIILIGSLMTAVAVSLGLYVSLLNVIGFDVASCLFVLAVMLICGERRPIPLIVYPVIVAVVLVAGFRALLPYPMYTVVI